MARYIWGLDPASKNDFFGIVVHELKNKTPKLRAINQLRHTSFDRLYDYLVKDMAIRYPPYYIVIDYSNEKTFADMLMKRYTRRVETISFTTDNKLMLKEDGLSVLKQGYKFPNPAKILEPTAAKYVTELMQQLKREQMLQTRTGKTTFDHPSGQHNDLAIAWELSIHGCLKYMNAGGGSLTHVGGGLVDHAERRFRSYDSDVLTDIDGRVVGILD